VLQPKSLADYLKTNFEVIAKAIIALLVSVE